jgi:hypothetical protein
MLNNYECQLKLFDQNIICNYHFPNNFLVYNYNVVVYLYTGCLMKNASTHNFFIYDPISMNKKNQRYGFSSATKQPLNIFFFGVIFNS